MQTINITVHTDDIAQIEAIKAVFKAFKVKFEISKQKPYNPEFVEKIKQGEADLNAGKGRKVTLDELNRLWK